MHNTLRGTLYRFLLSCTKFFLLYMFGRDGKVISVSAGAKSPVVKR